MDIAQYLLLFLPGMVMFTWLSWEFAAESWDLQGRADDDVAAAGVLVQDGDPGELGADAAAGHLPRCSSASRRCAPASTTAIRSRRMSWCDGAAMRRAERADEPRSPRAWCCSALLFVVILGGFPISFTLIFLGMVFGYFGLGNRVFYLMTYQVFDTMMDTVLAAVALFTFMGYVLESAGLMTRLFRAVQLMFGRVHGALFIATIFTATLFAAATGIVGASVTIIALMAAPAMLRSKYDVRMSAGTICAGGTLGILIPPSVMLVVMGPVCSVSVARLYAGALLPGLLLAFMYVIYTMVRVWLNPKLGPPLSGGRAAMSRSRASCASFFFGLLPPLALIIATLGSIVTGWATPTEGAALGCVGALLVTRGASQAELADVQGLGVPHRANHQHGDDPADGVDISGLGVLRARHARPSSPIRWWPGTFRRNLLILAILVLCFILGWPLEWVPIVVIIVPIFLPLLKR